MSIFTRRFPLKRLLKVSILSNRETARFLMNKIDNSWFSRVVLDFEGITFASRSFMDELNHQIQQRKNRTIEKVNMSADVRQMDEYVLQTEKNINKSKPQKEQSNSNDATEIVI